MMGRAVTWVPGTHSILLNILWSQGYGSVKSRPCSSPALWESSTDFQGGHEQSVFCVNAEGTKAGYRAIKSSES